MTPVDFKTNNKSITHFAPLFAYDHLPEHLQTLSRSCALLAEYAVENSPENAELAAGLRKLLEAKDCFVRAQVVG